MSDNKGEKALMAVKEYFFSTDPAQREVARELYLRVKDRPLICPHGHVDPRMLASEEFSWGTPVDLLIIPDHYIFRMLYSQGISLTELGIPRKDGAVEKDHRKIWQLVCDHWYLFRGTPSSAWMRDELRDTFGIEEKITSANAQTIYDALEEKLRQPEFQPRRLFERFQIEALATTDAATDTLEYHQEIRRSGWSGRVIPTFRPDKVINIENKQFSGQMQLLGEVSGIEVTDYRSYIAALEQRRSFFKAQGATATDQGAQSAYTEHLSEQEAESIFQRALKGQASEQDTQRFTGHMLIEMARMSVEDGLVMQVHIGSYRNHNETLFTEFGADMGADIPTASEFTKNFKPLLNRFGNNQKLTLVLFNLDETVYSRELAPLAGHYPVLRLGPPWWFFDSWNGMKRYFENVVETAGIYNTAGFNDDTRAYPSIPARHDLWRRACVNWLAGLIVREIIDEEDGQAMIEDMAYGLAKQTYRL
jgi:glucuronate isomerase